MTDELKIVLEMFATITDGALIGGITWLVLDFVGRMVPWFIGAYLGRLLLDKLPNIKIRDDK
jgi:hypothetical protein